MIFNAQNLPKWRMVETARGDFNVMGEHGAIIFSNVTKETATLVCAAPKAVKFLLTFDRRHPCRVDVGRVLSQCGIQFEDEANAEPAPAVE